jgi:surface antigen
VIRTRSLIGTLLMAVVLIALPPVTSPASASSTYLCTGYKPCQQAGYPHFGYKAASKKMWWRMFSGHNCTNYVAYRLVKGGMSADRPWGSTGMAYNWGRANKSITDKTPMVGAVAWWDANSGGVGSSGHVAYVEQVISKRKIIISEDSWSGDFHWATIKKAGGGWPSGFVHFDDRAVTLKSSPVISGKPAVGSPVTASTGTWSPAGSYTFQWYADGKLISGATSATFTPTIDYLRQPLSVRVSATKKGYLGGSAMSANSADVIRGTMTHTSAPAISGSPRVDEVLEVDGGSWLPAPDSTTIQWYADAKPISGATGTKLHLGQEQIRQRITVTMTAHRTGYMNSAVTSAATAPVAAGTIDVTQAFELSGLARMGRTLTVTPGSYDPNDADVTYTWLRNSTPVADATGRTYALGAADVGKQISMQIKLSHIGYRDRTVTLSTDGVVTTVPDLSVTATGKPGRAVVVLRVSAPGVASPGGDVTVKIGKHVVTGRVVDGRLKVVLDGLPVGKHTVKVAYDGTDAILAAKTKTTVRIPRH